MKVASELEIVPEVQSSESKISNRANHVRSISNQQNATCVKVTPMSKLPHFTLQINFKNSIGLLCIVLWYGYLKDTVIEIIKRWYYSAAHWHLGDVMIGNITFLWFLLFSMCESLHVAVKMYINYIFFYILIILMSLDESRLCRVMCLDSDISANVSHGGRSWSCINLGFSARL